MSKYLVIGHPAAHSLSPEMQNAAFRFHGLGSPYGKLDVAPEKLREFTRAARDTLSGFNATIPHKQALLPLVDEIETVSLTAGSINTVKVIDGKLIGTSTDGIGIERALIHCFGDAGAAAYSGTVPAPPGSSHWQSAPAWQKCPESRWFGQVS